MPEDFMPEEMAEEPADEDKQEKVKAPAKCRHCGAKPDVEPTTDDWLCEACERYQDFAICPKCGSAVRASVLEESE